MIWNGFKLGYGLWQEAYVIVNMCGNYDCRFGPFVAQQTQYAGMLIIPCGSHANVV